MTSKNKINELRQKEIEMKQIFEEMKIEKRAEIVEQIKQYLMNGETEKAKIIIEKLEDLKDFNLETNIHLIDVEDAFEWESTEINYEQLKVDIERKDEMKEIDNIFIKQLQKKGYKLEEENGNLIKISKGEKILYFFEINEEQNLVAEIEENMKYQSLLIGAQTMEKEEVIVNKINEWIKSSIITPEQKESFKKYISINVTSQERLNKNLESMKKIKIA